MNLTNSVSSMTEIRDERPLPSSNTPEHVEDWEVDKDNKYSMASNKATGSLYSADRINNRDNEFVMDNSGINLSKATVDETWTVVTTLDNQQECQVNESMIVVDNQQEFHVDKTMVVGNSVENQQECDIDESAVVMTPMDNQLRLFG